MLRGDAGLSKTRAIVAARSVRPVARPRESPTLSAPSRPPAADLHGLVLIDKPRGWSSMDVIRRLRRLHGRKLKAGHAGTLDPLATGLLVVGLGRGTKAISRVMGLDKTYVAEVDLSGRSRTDDAEGPIDPLEGLAPPPLQAVEAAVPRFGGEIDQHPPAFSAVHVEGKRAYQLARRGEAVELPPRRVRVDRIAVDAYDWPVLRLTVDCGKGVYIRSLARDLGAALGVGGFLRSLRRTRIGPYHVDRARAGEALDQPLTPGDLEPVPPRF